MSKKNQPLTKNVLEISDVKITGLHDLNRTERHLAVIGDDEIKRVARRHPVGHLIVSLVPDPRSVPTLAVISVFFFGFLPGLVSNRFTLTPEAQVRGRYPFASGRRCPDLGGNAVYGPLYLGQRISERMRLWRKHSKEIGQS